MKSETPKRRNANDFFSKSEEIFSRAARVETKIAITAMIMGRCQETSLQLSNRERKAMLELRKMITSEVPEALASGVL